VQSEHDHFVLGFASFLGDIKTGPEKKGEGQAGGVYLERLRADPVISCFSSGRELLDPAWESCALPDFTATLSV
jgi:hypothetical protein